MGDICTIVSTLGSDDDLTFLFGAESLPAQQVQVLWTNDVAASDGAVLVGTVAQVIEVRRGVASLAFADADPPTEPFGSCYTGSNLTDFPEAEFATNNYLFENAFHLNQVAGTCDTFVAVDDRCGYIVAFDLSTGTVTFPVGWEPDPDPILDALRPEWGVAADDAGVVYSVGQFEVVAIRPDQTAEVVAGDGELGYADGPAAESQVYPGNYWQPTTGGGLIWHDGSLYLADSLNGVVRRIDLAERTVSTVAGVPPGGVAERDLVGLDGLVPTAGLDLMYPDDVAAGADGELYVSIPDAHCVVVVRGDTTEPVAGRCGEGGYSGDGGPATEALLFQPTGIDVSPDGTWLYVVDQHQIVRAVKLREGPPSPAVAP